MRIAFTRIPEPEIEEIDRRVTWNADQLGSE
jgi:hypothetical protein